MLFYENIVPTNRYHMLRRSSSGPTLTLRLLPCLSGFPKLEGRHQQFSPLVGSRRTRRGTARAGISEESERPGPMSETAPYHDTSQVRPASDTTTEASFDQHTPVN